MNFSSIITKVLYRGVVLKMSTQEEIVIKEQTFRIRKAFWLIALLLVPLPAAAAPDTLTQSVTYNGETITMQLTRQDLRGDHFEVLIQNSSGGYDPYIPVAERSYIGTVDQHPDAISFGVLLDNGQVMGGVSFDRGVAWYSLDDQVYETKALGYSRDQFSDFKWSTSPVTIEAPADQNMQAFDVALDLSWGYYSDRAGHNVAKALEMAEVSVNNTRALYMRDGLVRPYLARVIIRTSQAHDPHEAGISAGSDWKANQTDAERDMIARIKIDGGGVALVGCIGGAGCASKNYSKANGTFYSLWLHEGGHNWSLGHAMGGKPEGGAIMSTSVTRYSGAELYKLHNHRASRVNGVLDNEGVYAAVDIPPYAAYDAVQVQEGTQAVIDVLANDFDANGHSINLTGNFDNISDQGGSVVLSPGTGPGGRDELLYNPPAGAGEDGFNYEIMDARGQWATGRVQIQIVSETGNPTPDPMNWSVQPYMDSRWPGSNVATMTATTATDPDGGIQYYFECVEAAGANWNGCEDSGWQTSNTFSDWYLVDGFTFTYRVKARDALGNETGWSPTAIISLGGGGGGGSGPPTPDPMSWSVQPYMDSRWPTSNVATMTATTASDSDGGIEYYFECVEAAGGYWNGCEASGWQTSSTFSDWYLEDGFTFTYRVKARDALGNETGWSPTATISLGGGGGGSDGPNVIMSWVPPYSFDATMTSAEADLGACSPKDVLTRVGLQWWIPNPDGTIDYQNLGAGWGDPNDADVAWWRNWATANGVELLLTIYNIPNDGSIWDWNLARSAFKDNRATHVAALVAEVERLGLDGVDIDYEGIDPDPISGDREAFAQFIAEFGAELHARDKVLTIDSFPYIWNAPNVDWWPDWVGHVDNIHSMGYAELYEGGSGWHKYSWQQSTGVSAGLDSKVVLMGMPAWEEAHSNWGVSSGRGISAQAHVQEVRYDLPYGSTGIAIWDMQLKGWQDSDLWCEIEGLRGVDESNDPPTADFSYSTTGLNADFTDSSTDSDGSVVLWDWDFGDGNLSSEQSPSHGYAAAGTYTVTLTVYDDGDDSGFSSQEVTVTVSEPNFAPPADAGSDQTVADSDGEAGESVALDGSGSGDSDGSIVSYAWTWSGGSASGVNPTVNLPDGTMVVTLTVTDDDGATDNDTVSITVDAPPPPPYWDQFSTASSTQEGSASGGHANTHDDDGTLQTITEQESGGKPNKRRSSLQHQWTFNVSAGTAISLTTNAWISGPADVDEYTFSYSTDGSNFTNLFTVSSTDSGNMQSAVLPASLNGTVYVRVVDSDNEQGERVLGQLSVDHLVIRTDNQPVTPPAAPSGLSAVAVAHNRVDLDWTDNALDETAYHVERSNSGSWSQVATLVADATSYSDTSVSAEMTYTYRVLAIKGATQSVPSNEASATTPVAEGASIELSAQTGSQGKRSYVDLSWSGAGGSNVLIKRGGAIIATTANDGAYSDSLGKNASGSYEYLVCETDDSACSDPVTVSF